MSTIPNITLLKWIIAPGFVAFKCRNGQVSVYTLNLPIGIFKLSQNRKVTRSRILQYVHNITMIARASSLFSKESIQRG